MEATIPSLGKARSPTTTTSSRAQRSAALACRCTLLPPSPSPTAPTSPTPTAARSLPLQAGWPSIWPGSSGESGYSGTPARPPRRGRLVNRMHGCHLRADDRARRRAAFRLQYGSVDARSPERSLRRGALNACGGVRGELHARRGCTRRVSRHVGERGHAHGRGGEVHSVRVDGRDGGEIERHDGAEAEDAMPRRPSG